MQNEKHISIIKNCLLGQAETLSNVVVFSSGSSINVDVSDVTNVDVVDIAALWYLLIELKSKAKTISKDKYDAIIERLDYFKLRYNELSAEHKKYFKGR